MKRSRKLVNRLACRDPTEDMDDIQPTPENSAPSNKWDEEVEDIWDDQMLLSQARGAPEASQSSPEQSQQAETSQPRRKKRDPRQPIDTSRPAPRRGSRHRKPPTVPTPGTDALGKRKGRILAGPPYAQPGDRKSTRLNSSHAQ